MKKHHLDTIITKTDIQQRIQQLGAEITQFYQEQNASKLIIVGLLRGSFIFMADLVRAISMPVEIDFMTVSSYGNATQTSHNVKINKDLDGDIQHAHVLIVEDIIDTGHTLQKIRETLACRHPASLHICTLLDKPSRREVSVPVKWVGFAIPDEFIAGYGIDYAQQYRHLDHIAKVIMDE